jgi:Animal haem peroxidase
MAAKHSEILRGLTSVKASPLSEGRFGRMFRNLPSARFESKEGDSEANLNKLALAMVADFDAPKDGKDDEESGIPALYTYFGQFVDHDITFDPMSTLIKQQDPDALIDFRTPAFDLDNVYGRGPGDQPYMYDGPMTFLLGSDLSGTTDHATDLPRNSKGRALIGDPRNDENSIVSQLQGLFLRFHNRLVTDHSDLDLFEIQQLMRFHYQYIVLNDFLPKIVSKSVLDGLKTDGKYDRGKLKYFHWKSHPFMPVEFSVAAYRLGHSMIRPGYRLNDNDDMLLPIFPVPPKFPKGLTGFQTMEQGRAIDWGRFIDIDIRPYDGSDAVNKKRLQLAYRIDTSLVNPLGVLPSTVADDPPPSLAARNLRRGWLLGLPAGQDVARAMGVAPLKDDQILIGKVLDNVTDPGDKPKPIVEISKVFADNCPLWTYILAETRYAQEPVVVPVAEKVTLKTPRLGPVGGRIVAEVFLGLMFGDGRSLLSLHPRWHPKSGEGFALKDMVTYALGKGPSL